MYGRRQLAIFKGGCHETERGGMHVKEALEGVHSMDRGESGFSPRRV